MITFKKTEGVQTSNHKTCIWIQEVILDFKRQTNSPIGKVVIDVVSSDIDKNFNGFAKIVVFDKEEILTTLSNDGAEASPAFKYKYRPNPIFSGKVVVVNGSFNGSFIVPKDIRYNFGAGRFSAL